MSYKQTMLKFKGKFQDASKVQKNRRYPLEEVLSYLGWPVDKNTHKLHGEAFCKECKKVATHSKLANGSWLYYCGFHAPDDAKCFCNNKKK